jgi:hypothetical protein
VYLYKNRTHLCRVFVIPACVPDDNQTEPIDVTGPTKELGYSAAQITLRWLQGIFIRKFMLESVDPNISFLESPSTLKISRPNLLSPSQNSTLKNDGILVHTRNTTPSLGAEKTRFARRFRVKTSSAPPTITTALIYQ